MSDKKFANLHYPGIKANPNENDGKLPELVSKRFEVEISKYGEQRQKALYETSVLMGGITPLTIKLIHSLAAKGVGRIGLIGTMPFDEDICPKIADSKPTSVSEALLGWFRQKEPWFSFESFAEISLMRSFEDISRGFNHLIWFVDEFSNSEKALSSVEFKNLMGISLNSKGCLIKPITIGQLGYALNQGMFVLNKLALRPSQVNQFSELIADQLVDIFLGVKNLSENQYTVD
ncbi:MAG: hypothetical protein AB7F43_04460 [Bacteriovoracia bacterium]